MRKLKDICNIVIEKEQGNKVCQTIKVDLIPKEFPNIKVGYTESCNQELQITYIHKKNLKKDLLIQIGDSFKNYVHQVFILQGQTQYFINDQLPITVLKNQTFIDLHDNTPRGILMDKKMNVIIMVIHYSLSIFEQKYKTLQESSVIQEDFRKFLINAKGKSYNLYNIDPLLKELTYQILSIHYKEELKFLYMKTKIKEGFLIYFTSILQKQMNQKALNEEDCIKIKQIELYISQLFDSPLQLNDLSRKMGMSETDMQRKFKTYTGKSIMQYHKEYILRSSIEKIKKGEPIKSIAYDLGYGSIAAYSKAFKRYTGYSPTEFVK